MAEFLIRSDRRMQILDITEEIASRIPEALRGRDGICHVFCPHTTAGLTVNENADPDVKHDLLEKLDRLIPAEEDFYLHAEGNSAAHLKAALLGFSVAVPVYDGHLELGVWQGIYLCEFDGPRTRKVRLLFQEAIR